MITSSIVRRIVALNLPAEAMREVLSILAEAMEADETRKECDRLRQQRHRDKITLLSRDSHGDSHVGCHVTDNETPAKKEKSPGPPIRKKEERKKDSLFSDSEEESSNKAGEAKNVPDFDFSIAAQERELFARGKQVLGDNAGGVIVKLVRNRGSVPLARASIETAATKHNPREYVGALLRGGTGTIWRTPRNPAIV
jgi:hypothetical protein